MLLTSFAAFCAALREAGFSTLGPSPKGGYSVIPHGWDVELPGSPLRWHSGEREHDPWLWRLRVLEECDDIAYGKVFFRAGGFLTAQWYPHFLAVRREGLSFDERWRRGEIGRPAKRVYDVLRDGACVPMHELRVLAGFPVSEKAAFDRAVTELQMGMFVTICGAAQKRNARGEPYGWKSTVLCTVEQFWGERLERSWLPPARALAELTEQARTLMPEAAERELLRFLRG